METIVFACFSMLKGGVCGWFWAKPNSKVEWGPSWLLSGMVGGVVPCFAHTLKSGGLGAWKGLFGFMPQPFPVRLGLGKGSWGVLGDCEGDCQGGLPR